MNGEFRENHNINNISKLVFTMVQMEVKIKFSYLFEAPIYSSPSKTSVIYFPPIDGTISVWSIFIEGSC